MANHRQRQRKQTQRDWHEMRDTERALSVIEKGQSRQLAEQSTDDGFVDLYTNGQAIRPPIPLESLLTLMESNSTHAGAINAKATDSVGRGWHLDHEDDTEETEDGPPPEPQDADDEAEDAEEGEPDVEDEHTAAAPGDDQEEVERKLRDWLRAVCTRLKFPQLVSQAYREYDGMGWGVWEVVRESPDVSSDITDVLPLPGHTLRATKLDGVFVQVRNEKRVYFKAFGKAESVSASKGNVQAVGEDDEATEVIIFKQYSPRSDHYGVPSWVSAAPDLAELAAIREFNIGFFSSGGKVDRLVHVTDSTEEDAKVTANSITTKMRESARKSHGHVSVVTWGGQDSKVTVSTLEPKSNDGSRESSFKVERKELRSQVLVAHQVPPYRVGLAELGSLGGNAAKEMLAAYRFGTIEPGQEVFEELLESTIFNPELGGFDLAGWSFRFNNVDWEELERDIDAAAAGVNNGVLTPNEGRELIGKDPLDTEEANSLYWQGVPLVAGGDLAAHVTEAAKAAAADAARSEATAILREMRAALEVIAKVQPEPEPE